MRVLELGCGGVHHGVGERYCFDCDSSLSCERLFCADFNDAEVLPYEDGFFDSVVAWNFVEHVVRVERLLGEVGRVLKRGGCFEFVVPHASSVFGWGNPEHKHVFLRSSFDESGYWMRGWRLVSREFFGFPGWKGGLSYRLSCLFGVFGEVFLPLVNRFVLLRFVLRKV